jgi:hypothetical protein
MSYLHLRAFIEQMPGNQVVPMTLGGIFFATHDCRRLLVSQLQ